MDHRIVVPMTQELLRAVDEWRRQQPDLPNRAEAVRRLIERSLGSSAERQ